MGSSALVNCFYPLLPTAVAFDEYKCLKRNIVFLPASFNLFFTEYIVLLQRKKLKVPLCPQAHPYPSPH